MKLTIIILFTLILSSCGKKGDASNGVTPLLPALETSALEDSGLRLLNPSKLPKGEPTLICFNTETLNSEKIELLKEYLLSKDSVLVKLIPEAIASLEKADPDSRFCPKIFLSIGL